MVHRNPVNMEPHKPAIQYIVSFLGMRLRAYNTCCVTLRGRIKVAARILNQLKPFRATYCALIKHQSALTKLYLTNCESALTIDCQ